MEQRNGRRCQIERVVCFSKVGDRTRYLYADDNNLIDKNKLMVKIRREECLEQCLWDPACKSGGWT